VLPENVRLIVSILTVLCLLGVSSGRDRERTLDEPVRAQLTQAKQLPVIAAARRQASLLDAQLHAFTGDRAGRARRPRHRSRDLRRSRRLAPRVRFAP
jgi:hypothetical protein